MHIEILNADLQLKLGTDLWGRDDINVIIFTVRTSETLIAWNTELNTGCYNLKHG